MDVTVNYWIMLTPLAEVAVGGVAQVRLPNTSEEPNPLPEYIPSVTIQGANTLGADTRRMLRNFPERWKGYFPPSLWNCYVTAENLSSLTAMREDLQELMADYPEDFIVAGCWDYYTGEPIGGVGSPWFVTPPGLAAIMPGIQQPSDPGPWPPPSAPPVFGVLQDIVLGAGQARRKFV